MTNTFEQLLPLAERLDVTYCKALDRLESHVVDTVGLNRDVRAILAQDHLDVIPFSTDFASSPREVFNAFAEALAARVLPELAVASGKPGFRITDLMDWSDMPIRGNSTEHEHQLAKIAYARAKSMQSFLQQLVIRFNPTALPEAAIHRALQDVISTFSVHTAMGIAVPVRRDDAPAILRYTFNRLPDEQMWHLLQRHHAAIIRGTNALATIALLNKQPGIATALSDMLTTVDVRLSQTMMRYDSGQAFHAATYLKMTLQRDGADFHFGSSMFDLVRDSLNEHISDIHIVYH